MVPVRVGGRAIPDGVGHGVLAFIFLYFMTVVTLTFAMLLTGFDFDSSFTVVLASINNTAHGFGPPGGVHNLHSLSTLQTWICTVAMFLGRLEIFSVIVLLLPAYWRK
jgi:trk system potassium uptake protein TrkH